jgi:hypothetical protein
MARARFGRLLAPGAASEYQCGQGQTHSTSVAGGGAAL